MRESNFSGYPKRPHKRKVRSHERPNRSQIEKFLALTATHYFYFQGFLDAYLVP